MSTLFFDTETTGLVKHRKDHTDPAQPMAVQIGMKLDATDRQERGALNFMVRTDGWTVSKEAAAVTGIDNLTADSFGVALIPGVEMFLDYAENATTLVAHNMDFDIIVMRRMTKVWAEATGLPYYDPFEGKKLVCTMKAATPICKMEPKRYGDWKWPKLEEAMRFFFNETLEGAHDALVDVRGCARVYYHLLDTGVLHDDYQHQRA